MTTVDEQLFDELCKCVDAEREAGPRSSFTTPPLSGVPLELVREGYLIPEPLGPLIVFSVTDAGFMAVAH